MLPSPRARLAGCVWLPRFLAKARQVQADQLPPEYAARFCAPDSVDDHFLTHFALAKGDALDALRRHPEDADFSAWFLRLPTVNAERIAQWNELAENLGRPGYPMAARFKQVRPTMYAHLDASQRLESIFDLLAADERPGGG